ncbi:uncharacterized protein PF11_0207-like isoform X2 [Coccinella septempunctata]|uniref:uncharacterized protein PF11_0207-like isoform X2 n=1 Tax=Coccinella septempunctata TaxID=41139 RepID=UPI001D05DA61|nr:uncharacterized protein PF11_0207-like isoform X2 [Coccinella septempunctata]
MASKKLTPRKSATSYRVCTLESISEERELETSIQNSTSTESRKKAIPKKFSTNFTPFRSSWNTCSSKTTEKPKFSGICSRGIMRQQFDSLKRDYEELLEINRLQEVEKKSAVSRVVELEKKCQQLKNLSQENIDKLNLERNNAEQIKTDYEFLLDEQNKKFKRRELELLEELDKYASNVDDDKDTSIENETDISIVNKFEYEEITEKLKSFERQNDLLQRNRQAIESQNKIMNNTLAELKKSYTQLELKYNALKNSRPKWLNIQLGINENFPKTFNNSEKPSMITKETQTEISLGLEEVFKHEEKSGCGSEQIKEKGDIFEQEEILFELHNMLGMKSRNYQLPSEMRLSKQKTISNDNDTLNLNKFLHNEKFFDESQEIGRKNESYAHFLYILKICLANIYATYKISYSEYVDVQVLNNSIKILNMLCTQANNTIVKNNTDFEEYNTMNLSDSEKINKNIFMEERTTDAEFEQLRESIENSKRLSSKCNGINDKKTASLIEIIENLSAEIEELKKQNYSQKFEYEKLSNLIQEKDRDMNDIQNEITETKKENENCKQYISDLTSLIDNQRLKLKNLVEISCNNNNLRNKTNDSKSGTGKENHLETKDIDVHKSGNKTWYMDMIHSLNVEMQMKNNTEMFDQSVVQLQTRLIYLKNDNKSLRESISKIRGHAQEIRSEYVKYANEIEEHIKNFEADIRETREVYERTFELVREEIKTKNSLIHTLQRQVKECTEKNEKLYSKKEDTTKTRELEKENTEINSKNKSDKTKIEQDNRRTFESRKESQIETQIIQNIEKQTVFREKVLTNTEESIKSIEIGHLKYSSNNSGVNIIDIVGFEKWNPKFEEKSESCKVQNCEPKNLDAGIMGEFKRGNRFKLSRTREYDSRRNIDFNSLHE